MNISLEQLKRLSNQKMSYSMNKLRRHSITLKKIIKTILKNFRIMIQFA